MECAGFDDSSHLSAQEISLQVFNELIRSKPDALHSSGVETVSEEIKKVTKAQLDAFVPAALSCFSKMAQRQLEVPSKG